MKKKKFSVTKIIATVIFSICVVFVLIAGVYSFAVLNNPDVIAIGAGEEYTLSHREAEFSLRSYHPDVVAPVSNDTVTGIAVGEGVVGVRYTYFDRDFYKFRVVDAPQQITLDKTELSLGVGESYTLEALCKVLDKNFDVTFSSDNESVATVSDDGSVTASGVGKCDIVARAYNNIESKCTVTVSKAPTKLSFDKSGLTLGVTESVPLSVKFNKGEYAQNVTYKSSDENVAVIEAGIVSAKSEGECTLTATCYNNTQAKCQIKVKKMPQEINLLVNPKQITGSSFKVLYEIPSDSAAYNVDVAVSDENILKIDSKDKMLIHCIKIGEASVTVTLSNGVSKTKTIIVDDYKAHSISFTTLNQFPSLPTGCEVVSLTSVLRHYGCDIDAITMADKYMPKVSYDYFSVSPHDYFLGDPHTRDGFGCFSGCLVKTAENYFKDKNIDDYKVIDISGCSTDELYSFLENDIPVITWVTSGFVIPTRDGSWNVNGETVNWCNHEHCLVTIGYDKNSGTVTVADNSGGYNYSLSMDRYEEVFKGMGSMAVAVLKK